MEDISALLAQVASSDVAQAVTSVQAQRLYAGAAIVVAFVASLVGAQRQLGILKGVRAAELDSDKRISGREPEVVDTLQRHVDFYKAERNKILGGVWRAMSLLGLLGILIPSALVFTIVWIHDWLLPGYVSPVLWPDTASAPTLGDLALFLLDQVFRGALADIPEVFRLGLTPVSNNPSNILISWLVVIYRFAVGIVTGGLLYMGYRVWRGVPKIDRRIRDYEERIRVQEQGAA